MQVTLMTYHSGKSRANPSLVLEEGHIGIKIGREMDMVIYTKKTLRKRLKEKHAGV